MNGQIYNRAEIYFIHTNQSLSINKSTIKIYNKANLTILLKLQNKLNKITNRFCKKNFNICMILGLIKKKNSSDAKKSKIICIFFNNIISKFTFISKFASNHFLNINI